ncbi:MAG: hypothetical protein J4F40_18640 [Alphaproteobacteria bacterium]|nr:hypothetical protein [Alphaproteobacteria bacterium]
MKSEGCDIGRMRDPEGVPPRYDSIVYFVEEPESPSRRDPAGLLFDSLAYAIRGATKSSVTVSWMLNIRLLHYWVNQDEVGYEARDRSLLMDVHRMENGIKQPHNELLRHYGKTPDSLLFGMRLTDREDLKA